MLKNKNEPQVKNLQYGFELQKFYFYDLYIFKPSKDQVILVIIMLNNYIKYSYLILCFAIYSCPAITLRLSLYTCIR